jgi:nucleoid-associated protein YgaU
MSIARFFLFLLTPFALVSCGIFGPAADLKYPSVQQADDMDVTWGLERRKPRGGPKQFFQSRSTAAAAAGFTGEAPAAPAPSAPATAPAPSAPAPAAAPQPSVNVPASLR